MPLIPYTSFIIYYPIGHAEKFQDLAVAAILLATLIIQAYKKKLAIPFAAIPYLILPIWLLASINTKLEHSSNDALLCFSMLAAAILVFSQNELYNKWLLRNTLACAGLHLIVQIYGITHGHKLLAIKSVFPLANEIAFFYMIAIFAAIFVYFKDSSPTWKWLAKIIGSLALISIMLGDPNAYGVTKTLSSFKISREDAVGIWLGLACGASFTAFLLLWRKFKLPSAPAICITACILLTLMFAGAIAVNSSIFKPGGMDEAASRLVNWQAAWNLIKENPLGAGFGAYGANIMQNWPTLDKAYYIWPGVVFNSAHNQYLQILTEIGWPGLIYYSALFALPWLISIIRYLETGEKHFLFIAGTLAAVLSFMEVSEAMSMFAFSQIIHWGFLLHCAKATLPNLSFENLRFVNLRFAYSLVLVPLRFFNLRFAYSLVLVPLIAFLLFDRGKQLYTVVMVSKIDRGASIPLDEYEKTLDKALSIHPKNPTALWRKGFMHMKRKEYPAALKHLDSIYDISGLIMPVNHARADTYLELGNPKKACEYAKPLIDRFADRWTLQLKERLGGCR
jgi:O-antigen ligase